MRFRDVSLPLAILIVASSVIPAPAVAASDSDRVPAWVPGTVIGAFLVGGVLYVRHLHRGETSTPLPPKDRVSELVSHLATPEESDELGRIKTEAEANTFLDRFYARRDPTPETTQNEFRDEQLERYRRANELYGTRPVGWGGDRRRVFFIYGPPDERKLLEVRGRIQPAERWTSGELWIYNTVAGPNPLPPLLQNPGLFDTVFREPLPVPGRRLFLFINQAGEGACRLGFSTEAGEVFDHSIYQAGANGE